MKMVFYIPAILFTIFYGFAVMFLDVISISPVAYVWVILFSIAGILLSKDKFWGAFIGIIPGFNMIYRSMTKDTGFIDIEMTIGVTMVIFYVLCSGFVIFKKTKKD